MKGTVMNPESKAAKRAEVVDEVSKWGVGFGVIIVALFPLSIPFLLLTAVAVIPLVAPLLVVGLVVAILALPILIARGLFRMIRGRGTAPEAPTISGPPAARHP
jgi:hypothetical protein